MLPGAHPSLFSRWRRCRAGLAYAVFDVGQGAQDELQAVGQIGAVAIAQCNAPTHDVVAEACQVASVHAFEETYPGGNVELPYPLHSIRCLNRLHQRELV